MTTAEAQIAPISFHETQAEPPTARFTAVNNSTPTTQAPTTNGNGHLRRESEERPQAQPRVSPQVPEKLTITTSDQREDWAHPVNGDRSNQSAHQYPPSTTYSDSENSHKRKRSGSLDRATAQTSSTSSYHSHGLPASKQSQDDSPGTPREASIRAQSHSVVRESYVSPKQHYTQYPDEARENGSAGGLWYSQQGQESRTPAESEHSAVSHHISPEDQLREALQRDAQSADNQNAYSGTSPGEEEERGIAYQTSYTTDRTPLQIQADHKKRKRNFSNRTKTGCMTCRRRKKKCDETRPECNNCIRGGFVCNGYPSRGQWPKSEQKQAPVPLQSKDGYEAAAAQYVQATPYPLTQSGQQKREPLPGYRGQLLRVDAQQQPARPLGLDDDRQTASSLPSASASSPENRISSLVYGQGTPFPTPVSASPSSYPDRLSQNDYKRVPPLLDPSRQEHDSAQSSQASLPHISILHPSHNSSSHPHTPQSTNAQDAARLALSHQAATSRPRTQKEDMLAGERYYPFDRELVLERERCNAACWRFNSSTNPNNGVSQEERARQFRDILQPKELINISPTLVSPVAPMGAVGSNVVVEAPFTCDYGYNIHIGQDVAIGKNCTILDTCEVKIGDRCILGPNVQIYTATLPVDPKRRLGSKGPNLGKAIVIEEDCWIGGGVIILPGRTIKRGSTVGAGSIVTRDVPPYTVVCGNPARVIRGLYPNPPHD